MGRTLTDKTTLELLRKDAKRWLKRLRAGDPKARERLDRAWPRAPAAPVLRDVQHALALEYGLADWAALKAAIGERAIARKTHRERVDEVLRNGWGGDLAAAGRILQRYPEVATGSLHAACACADLAEVRRRLADDPSAAWAKGGPLDWEPLHYACYSRLGDPDATVAIAGLLLDAGADPNAGFDDGWGSPFKVLTGPIGEGEGPRPPHPRARELAELLIERGADPYDRQALYNTSIVADDTAWLELLYGRCEARGQTGRWRDPAEGFAIHGRPTAMLDYLLGNAVASGHLRRAAWLLERGADATGRHAYSGRPHHEVAQLGGLTELADLLVRHGAEPVQLDGAAAFQAACLRLDRPAAEALARGEPARLDDPGPMLTAAGAGRADVVDLLLELGASPGDADHNGATALHNAVMAVSGRIAERLIRAGADVDQAERRFNASALGWATHFGLQEMIDLLAPFSRDVGALASAGRLGRIVEVLDEAPDRVNAGRPVTGDTPLHLLPDEEALAADVAALLLSRGADPSLRNAAGLSAVQAARKRGLDEAADLIAEAAAQGSEARRVSATTKRPAAR